MRKTLISATVFILANAAGLLLAGILLSGFSISLPALFFASLLFSLFEVLIGPLIAKLAKKRLPAIEGGIALVITFAGLFVTSIVVDGMRLGGPISWLLASLIVWLGALLAGIIIPHFLFPKEKTSAK